MRKRKTKIRPPRTRTRTVTVPYIVCRNGKETRHVARLAMTYDGTGNIYFSSHTQLAAVIHRYIPDGAEYRPVDFDILDSGEMFFSRSGQRDLVDVVGGHRVYVERPGDTVVVFTKGIIYQPPWYYSSDFVSHHPRSGAATARKKGGSARAR